MMKMLRYSGLAVFVACIAAFASGCGGGGGGGSATTPEEPPVMECPQGQVGTYPDCTDPPPTDEDRIAEARRELSNILSNAQARAGAASSAAAAIQTNADATADQIANAISHSNAAQSALASIVSANTAATLATTPAEANTALGNARAAQGTLNTAASAISGIQGAVQAAANQRQQREANERALTNNSSLIKHLRDNKLLLDAVLGAAGVNLTADSLVVGSANKPTDIDSGTRTACTEPCAEYPANTRTSTTATTGQRTVRVQTTVSSSTTPLLTGAGGLRHGFDLKMETPATNTFVNAYTDIAQERRGARNDAEADDTTTPYDERYDYTLDADYLLAGIWLTVNNANLSESRITAFAYGGQPTSSAATNFCGSNEGTAGAGTHTDTTSTSGVITRSTKVCNPTDGFHLISEFVKDGQDFTATYRGNANGAYLAGSDTSYFTADVTLTAEFVNPTGVGIDGTGSIEGEVTNIVAGGQSMAGSIELQKQTLTDTDASTGINGSDKFDNGLTVGVVDGKSFGGTWKGQFFGMTRQRVTRSQTTTTVHERTDSNDPNKITATTHTITTTYSPQAPGSDAGTFYATQQSAPAGDAAFIGSFAAHR